MTEEGYKRNGISQWRWREIKAVLKQYDERIAKIREICGQISSGDSTVYKSLTSDPTGNKAIKIAKLRGINDKIDNVCSRLIQGDILRECFGYDQAIAHGYIGSKQLFYKQKRMMFVELDKIL